MPAAPPLGPWLELRGSTLCSIPGGYEEQMSCLLPSSSRLKAAHTSLKMTSWKVEPRKAPGVVLHVYFWEVVGGFEEVLKGELIYCRPGLLQPGVIHNHVCAHRAPSARLGKHSLWCQCQDVLIVSHGQPSLLNISFDFVRNITNLLFPHCESLCFNFTAWTKLFKI